MSDIIPVYSADQITLGIQMRKTTDPPFPFCTNKAEHGTKTQWNELQCTEFYFQLLLPVKLYVFSKHKAYKPSDLILSIYKQNKQSQIP